MLFPRHKQQRIRKPWSLVVAGSVLLLVVGWNQWMYVMKQMPACTFRALTGWLCPGCGARRSIVALSRGDLLLALRTNALIYFLGALVCGLAICLVRNEWRKTPKRVELPNWSIWLLFLGMFSFWLLRNIPHEPFHLLAPP